MFRRNTVVERLEGAVCIAVVAVPANSVVYYFTVMTAGMFIIIDKENSGAFNMATDRYLMEKCPVDEAVYLRLYSWNAPTVSLGCMQKADEILDFQTMKTDRVGWVYRPTGGRAILHDGDCTYTIVFPRTVSVLGRTIRETYRIVSQCLVDGFLRVGIQCGPHDTPLDSGLARREQKLPCFLAPNREEIMVQGKKLVGSAQKRTARAVLQHGSIPVTPAFRRLPRYLKVSETVRQIHAGLLKKKCCCVDELVPSCSPECLARSMARSFIERIGLPAREYVWTPDDRRIIESLPPREAHAQANVR